MEKISFQCGIIENCMAFGAWFLSPISKELGEIEINVSTSTKVPLQELKKMPHILTKI